MNHEHYMRRCIELAQLGAGNTAPNPLVGAVLVHNDLIIGEGYHRKYGEAHAEVNCINSVINENLHLIRESTMYVSLEPCAHYGKTPPCADLIIEKKIPEVIIGCADIYKEVDGKGIKKLKGAGIKVIVGILENECRNLNKRFFTYHQKQRPYIILKWAESANGMMAPADQAGAEERIVISNDYSNRLVHKWRAEEQAILVGKNTALKDDPSLTTRLWPGNDPVRCVIDKNLELPERLKIFDQTVPTLVFNLRRNAEGKNTKWIKLENDDLPELMNSMYRNSIQSVLVEGGAKLLQSFIDTELWDEARVIRNERSFIEKGLRSPQLKNCILDKQERLGTDMISYFIPRTNKHEKEEI